MCSLTDNIYDYHNVSQGKITVPNMDDGEEFQLTDVSYSPKCQVSKQCIYGYIYFKNIFYNNSSNPIHTKSRTLEKKKTKNINSKIKIPTLLQTNSRKLR